MQNTPIERLGLSNRAYNALKRAGIDTVEQLTAMTLMQLTHCRGIGDTLLAEIARKVSAWYLSVKQTSE